MANGVGVEPTTRSFGDRIANLGTFPPVAETGVAPAFLAL